MNIRTHKEAQKLIEKAKPKIKQKIRNLADYVLSVDSLKDFPFKVKLVSRI